MFFVRIFAALSLTVLVPALSEAQSEFKLDALADQLTHRVQLIRRDYLSPLFPAIVVIDFLDEKGNVNAAGAQLADLLSDSLTERLRLTEVLNRKMLRERLFSAGVSPSVLQDTDIARWIAESMGANLIVSGHLVSSDEMATLSVELVRISDAKELSTASLNLYISPNFKHTLDEPLPWPADSDVVVPCISTRHDAVAEEFRDRGVSQPICIHCPSVSIPDAARRAKYQGTVKLALIIDEKGQVKSSSVIKGDRYGFASQAVSVTKTWQLKPATREGKAVTACVPIEMSSHWY